MPRTAWVAALVLLGAGVAGSFVPFLTERQATLAGTPVPHPLTGRHEVVPVRPGDEVCWDSIALSGETDAAGFVVGTYFRSGQPLELTLEGTDIHERVRAPGGYADNSFVEFEIARPARERLVEACATNVGTRDVALYATSASNESARPSVTINGSSTLVEPSFVLMESNETSLLSRIPDMLSRAGRFIPLGWLAWPLFVLAICAIPTLPLLALRGSWRD